MIKTKIALPKGRFLQNSLSIIRKHLGCNSVLNFDTRKLFFESDDTSFFLLKVSDICELTFNGTIDIGIVPDEWMLEYEFKKNIRFKKLKKLEWIKTRISLILNSLDVELSNCDVVSTFPNIARQYLQKKGGSNNVNIHMMNGSIEATIPAIYPVGIDCIESGETLKQNGLKERDVIYDNLGLTIISYNNKNIDIERVRSLII